MIYLGVDQGTSGTTVVALDETLQPIDTQSVPVSSESAPGGAVEQDPWHVLETVTSALEASFRSLGNPTIRSVGFDHQGETVLAWNRRTLEPLSPAIVWSDTRAAVITRDIERRALRQRIEDLSSNRLDPYFCAAKYSWLLSEEPTLTEPGTELALGTLETWLLAQLSVEQATDIGTASRTQLTRLGGNSWDPELLELFGIPAEALAPIVPSLGDRGALRVPGMDEDLALTASLVDQPAALAGNGCIDPGTSKVTYGTGAFVVSNLGRDAPHGRGPLVASVGWGDSKGPVFIHDGGVFAAGSGLNWLASIGIDVSPAAQDQLRGRPPTGVIVSPALHGLGAPHWDRDAKAAILGMDASTTGSDILQAFLEAIAFRVAEILDASPIDDEVVRVDGGLTASTYLMQFQADVLGIPLGVGATPEATAVGSALLAGKAIGDLDDRSIRDATIPARIVEPTSTPVAQERFAAWKSALAALS